MSHLTTLPAPAEERARLLHEGLSDERIAIRLALLQLGGRGAPREIYALTGNTQENVSRLLGLMAEDGQVIRVKKGHYRHPDAPALPGENAPGWVARMDQPVTITRFAESAAGELVERAGPFQTRPSLAVLHTGRPMEDLRDYVIESNAMVPTLLPGDIIFGTVCTDNDFDGGGIYLVTGPYGVIVTRLQGEGPLVALCFDNADTPDFDLSRDEFNRDWQVRVKVHGLYRDL